MEGVKYLLELKAPGRPPIKPTVLGVSQLSLTGEGLVPFTTKLGNFTTTLLLTPELDDVLNAVSDYADLRGQLYDVTRGKTLLYAGVGDCKGTSKERTARGDVVTLVFCSPLEAQEGVDIVDGDGDPFDTLPWDVAVEKIRKAAGVPITASFQPLELNGYSVIRRLGRSLGNAKKQDDDADEVRAVAVLPDGAVAVGCGRFVILHKNRKWFAGAEVWYDTQAPVPAHLLELHNAAAAGGWTVLALGYRGAKLYGVAGARKGACVEFSFSPVYDSFYEGIRVKPPDLFWWWWDRCEIFSTFTMWESNNTGEGAVNGLKSLYTVGFPVPKSTKEIGGLVPVHDANRETKIAEDVSAYSKVIKIKNWVARVGDYVGIAGGAPPAKPESGLKVVEIKEDYWQELTLETPTRYFHNEDDAVYLTPETGWPRPNIKIARPSMFTIGYVNPLVEGGEGRLDIEACHHRGEHAAGLFFYRPVVSDDVTEAVLGPCFIALQADPELLVWTETEYRTEIPRQFLAYPPGRSPFSPDIVNGWAVKQTRPSKYHDQGDVWFYKDGAEVERGDAQGAAIQIDGYLVKEAVVYRPDGYYYATLKIQKYASGRNAFDLVWQSRGPEEAASGTEYYLTSEGVKHDHELYFGVKARERVWVDLDNEVYYANFAQADTPQAKGAVAIAVPHHVGDYVAAGDYLRVQGQERAFRVIETAEIYRKLHAPIGLFWVTGGDWEEELSVVGVCSGHTDFTGALTVIILQAPEFASLSEIKACFCRKKISISKRYRERATVLAFNLKNNTATEYAVEYNPATPKIDEEANHVLEKIEGEEASYDADAPPAFATFTVRNKNPKPGTAVVRVDGNEFEVEDVTAARALPAPWPQTAYVDYAAGDDNDELLVYLDERYRDAKVVVAYDYHPGVEVTAVWKYQGDIYYATSDGYLWRLDGESVGKGPKGDPPIRVAYGADDVYFVTRRGCLAQWGRWHSRSVEGEFGGDDVRAAALLGDLARADLTRFREIGGTAYIGPMERKELPAAAFTLLRGKAPIEYRAVKVKYAGGEILLGDPSAANVAEVPCGLVYTPQHAKVVAEAVYNAIRRRQHNVELTGLSAFPADVFTSTIVRLPGEKDTYEITGAALDRERFTVTGRRLPRMGAD